LTRKRGNKWKKQKGDGEFASRAEESIDTRANADDLRINYVNFGKI